MTKDAMPYSLSLQKGSASEQLSRRSSGGPPRRFSLSTPDELGGGRASVAASFEHASSLSDEEYLVSDNLQQLSSSTSNHGAHVEPPSFPSSRVQRLLQQRQLKHSKEAWCRGDGWIGRGTISSDSVSKLVPDCMSDVRDSGRQRLIVVANRLPVSATRKGNGWSLEVSAGGLVTALLGVRQFETRWIGWAGVNVVDEADQAALSKALEEQFPIGIDPNRFIDALESSEVQSYIKELQEKFCGRKVMLGVDRLDMIKGIPQKLLAFEKFLDENVKWRDKVQLVQIAVPTRTDVHDYQRLTSQVHEIVGRINGRFGTLTTVPIHHLDRSLDFHRLCALYAITDVALVTSLRDGMNLVSYEFVACQNMKKGVLILSELAGAAQSLGAGAILVNPWNISDVAAAINDALDMSEADRNECHCHNFEHVTTHTAQVWADTFVSELNDTVYEAQQRIMRIPPQLPVGEAVAKYHEARNRLLILGFNSTMTAQVEGSGRRGPEQIREMKLRLHHHLQEVFSILCRDPNTTIVVLSGSERNVLDEAFGSFDLWLAAENGMFLRHTRGDWKTTMPEHLNMDWMESVEVVFDYFRERTPRSYVETRDTSLVWNYKYADVEFGRVQARDLLQHLWTGPISNAAVDVVQGLRSVEVRPVGVSKGAAIDRILGEIVHRKRIFTPIDYVLCIGHFLSKDEDIYTFFEPELPYEREHSSNQKLHEGKASTERRLGQKDGGKAASKSSSKLPGDSSNMKSTSGRSKGAVSSTENGNQSRTVGKKDKVSNDDSRRQEGSSVLDLEGDNYFSCAVGRKRSNARYSLASSEDVVSFLKAIADSCNH